MIIVFIAGNKDYYDVGDFVLIEYEKISNLSFTYSWSSINNHGIAYINLEYKCLSKSSTEKKVCYLDDKIPLRDLHNNYIILSCSYFRRVLLFYHLLMITKDSKQSH